MPIKTATLKPPKPTEKEIQAAVMNKLQLHKWLVIRFNSSGFSDGKGHFIRAYLIQGLGAAAGFPDVVAFRNNGGIVQALLIEVKDYKGKLTDSQVRFHSFAQRFGIPVHVVRDVKELDEIAA